MSNPIKVGDIVEGIVKKITSFGAFVFLEEYQKDGLLHISQIHKKFVKDVNAFFSTGDRITVKVIEVKRDGKISLSTKGLMKKGIKNQCKYRFLPLDTNQILSDHSIDNYSLKVNRFIHGFRDQYTVDSPAFLQNIAGLVLSKSNHHLLSQLQMRFDEQLESMESSTCLTSSFTLQNDFRLIPGLGGANVMETNLTLHHIYGIPYLPGSSLKGLARAFAIEELREIYGIKTYKQVEQLLLVEELDTDSLGGYPRSLSLETITMYRHLFGTQERAGDALFFDAYPIGNVQTEVDVMTPHYKDYYDEMEKKSPYQWPVDYLDPTIIPFLVVKGTTFKFRIAVRFNRRKGSSDFYLKKVTQLLKDGLQGLGIGAKTMVGYGYFQ